MMTCDIVFLNKIVIVPAPAFYNLKWEAYGQINGWENQRDTMQLMGSERYTSLTPWHYLNKKYAFNLFFNGNSAYDAEVILGLPRTTADRYYKEFEAYRKSF